MPTATPDTQVRRNAQGLRVREEILDAASRVMSLHGYEGASISAIIKESGIQKSSIYWQFDSKAAIAAAVMERGARRFFDAIVIRRSRGNSAARLRKTLREVAVLLDEHEEFLRLFLLLLITNEDADVAVVLDRVRAEARARMHELLEMAFEAEGTDTARAVADRLAGLAVVALRRHLPRRADRRDRGTQPPGDQMADALHHYGEAIAAERRS